MQVNRLTHEEMITYKFTASINDEKARDKFIKRPLKLQLVLETIELGNFSCKYRDETSKQNKHRRQPLHNSSDRDRIAFTKQIRKRRTSDTDKKNQSSRCCHVCGTLNWTPEHSCPVRKVQ